MRDNQQQLTAGETALVEASRSRAGAAANGDSSGSRQAAIDALKTNGLPTRRREAWHYTDLRRLIDAFPPLAERPGSEAAKEAFGCYHRLVDAVRLPVLDGYFLRDYADELPNGVLVSSTGGEPAPGEPASPAAADDAVGLINTALAGDGVDIAVAGGTVLAKPIGVAQAVDAGAARAVATRNRVNVGAAAKATFVERHVSPAGTANHINAVTSLDIGDEGDVTWLIVQEHGDEATHLGQINVRLAASAKLTLLILNAGAKLQRQEVNVRVEGEGADFQLRCLNLLAGDCHNDVTMVLDHLAPATESVEVVRNVVMDRAQGVFQGQIRVAREAQKTDARMACNTLLLSDDAGYSAKPELEIFADDVACGHGATVAEIDHDHLFYLMSRGIGEREARGLLVKAFVAEIIDELEDEELATVLVGKLERWFAAHG